MAQGPGPAKGDASLEDLMRSIVLSVKGQPSVQESTVVSHKCSPSGMRAEGCMARA